MLSASLYVRNILIFSDTTRAVLPPLSPPVLARTMAQGQEQPFELTAIEAADGGVFHYA
jgi:hypothetical protein